MMSMINFATFHHQEKSFASRLLLQILNGCLGHLTNETLVNNNEYNARVEARFNFAESSFVLMFEDKRTTLHLLKSWSFSSLVLIRVMAPGKQT